MRSSDGGYRAPLRALGATRLPAQPLPSGIIRLYPAYWFAIAFTTAVIVALPGVWERLKVREILLNLTMLQSGSASPHVDGVYWTLRTELRFYLLFLAVVAMGLTYRRVVVFCCVWGAAAMLALIFTAFLLFMVAESLGWTDRIRWKWLVTAGALTYPLYLTHYLAGTAPINRLRDTMDPRLLLVVPPTQREPRLTGAAAQPAFGESDHGGPGRPRAPARCPGENRAPDVGTATALRAAFLIPPLGQDFVK